MVVRPPSYHDRHLCRHPGLASLFVRQSLPLSCISQVGFGAAIAFGCVAASATASLPFGKSARWIFRLALAIPSAASGGMAVQFYSIKVESSGAYLGCNGSSGAVS